MIQNKTSHPYRTLDERAFWKKNVINKHPVTITDWYQKKFQIDEHKIGTAGSCFAQHIGRHMRQSGFNYLDVEPAPDFLDSSRHHEYGYSMYSARYGNIYTTRQLVQLIQRALGEFSPQDGIWKSGNGFVDAFRPTIEPEPFKSIDELVAVREDHLNHVRELFEKSDIFIFTLGLTEAWLSHKDGAAYPVAPGVSGGEFNESDYKFHNFSYPEITSDMKKFMQMARSINPKMKFIYTVSPVPLMATASNRNVVVASSYSKSVLRAAAGFFADSSPHIDYFPSYEIISSHVMRSQFYNTDMRTVADYGVEHVMKQFFSEHKPPQTNNIVPIKQESPDNDVVCDEELIANFGAA